MKQNGLLKSDQHESQESKANRLETPEDIFYKVIEIIKPLGIEPPELDVFASSENSKCVHHISKESNAFEKDFTISESNRGLTTIRVPISIWANAPHDVYKLALPRIHDQYIKHDFNAIILIPTNNMRTNYWHDIVEPNRIDVNAEGYCFYFPLKGTIYFELDGNPMLDDKGRKVHAQNGYNVLLFVKKTKLKEFKANLSKVGICQ